MELKEIDGNRERENPGQILKEICLFFSPTPNKEVLTFFLPNDASSCGSKRYEDEVKRSHRHWHSLPNEDLPATQKQVMSIGSKDIWTFTVTPESRVWIPVLVRTDTPPPSFSLYFCLKGREDESSDECGWCVSVFFVCFLLFFSRGTSSGIAIWSENNG